jgi:hypothetical protein
MRQERPSFDPPPAPARPETPGPEPATPEPSGSPAHDAPLSPERDMRARAHTRDAQARERHAAFDENREPG